MVPVRAIAEALGAEVKWDGASRKVTIVRGGRELVLTIDNPKATINGKTFTMDTRPVIRQGRTMVPLRFVGELLGVRLSIGMAGSGW